MGTDQEIRIRVQGALLSGTLLVPGDTAGPHPVIVLIGGSGAHDRDAEVYGFSLLRLIAERLAHVGIASLRWDDRGVGFSTGERLAATCEELAGDVVAAIDTLGRRQEIRTNAIGLLGYSAGGLVATIAAARKRVMCVVLLASPAVGCEALLLTQGERMARWAYPDAERVDQAIRLLKDTFRAARGQIDWSVVESGLKMQISRDAPEGATASGSELASRVAESLALAQSRWYRDLLDQHPGDSLSRLDVPVLALFAEHDWHVAATENAAALRRASSASDNREIEVKTYPKANHLFIESMTGCPAEYSDLPKVPVARLLEDIASWVFHQTVKCSGSGVSRCIPT